VPVSHFSLATMSLDNSGIGGKDVLEEKIRDNIFIDVITE